LIDGFFGDFIFRGLASGFFDITPFLSFLIGDLVSFYYLKKGESFLIGLDFGSTLLVCFLKMSSVYFS
jgi:hypothetical protein